jgi:signal transduction histidine kinase
MTDMSIRAVDAVGGRRSFVRSTLRRPAAPAYIYLVVGAILTIFDLFTFGRPGELLYEGVTASCIAAIVIGIRRHRPTPSLPWWLLATGNALWLVGDALWGWYPYVMGHELPSPSMADLAYLLGYPPMMVAIALIVRSRGSVLRRESWLDALAVTLIASILIWEIAFQHYLPDGLSFSEAVNFAYPLMDVVLIGFFARLLFAPGARTTAYGLLIASFVVVFAADIVYAREVAADWWTFDNWLNAGWMAGYVLLGASALHPSMRAVTLAAERREQPLSRRRMAVLATIIALPMIDLLLGELRGQDDTSVDTAIVMIVILGLVALRLSSLIDASERQSIELAGLHRERGYVLDEITRAIEDERTRLSAELHDGPIQRLTGYGMRAYVGVRKLRGGDEASAIGTLEGIADGLNAEVRGLRALMSQLRPPVLSERGLVDALRDHADAIASERGIASTVEGPAELRLPPDVETGLYRIAQEALMNATRHSGGTRIDVKVEANDTHVRLWVRDDGAGFDAAEKLNRREGLHFGLLAMRERASMLHGELRIASVPGKGTKVTVVAPIGGQP